jgi:regulator of protease activity HflC (stomatin/prohibitin superfamily)
MPITLSFSNPKTQAALGPQIGVQVLVFVLGLVATIAVSAAIATTGQDTVAGVVLVILFLLTCFVTAGTRVASEWERVLVLSLGKFRAMRGPGLFMIAPILQTTPFRVDLRLVTYDVPKQSSLSKDNIPVTVDAIVYYRVANPADAVLKVEDYHQATQLGSQTVLRDLIGKALLDELLSERERLSEALRTTLDALTDAWGVKVPNVELKEVVIAEGLLDAISREPAAEREKRARLKLAEAEKLAASVIYEAAQIYERDPVALQLRSMNMLYEMCMEGRSTVIFVPTETHLGMPAPVGVYGLTDRLDALKPRPTPPGEPPPAEGPT